MPNEKTISIKESIVNDLIASNLKYKADKNLIQNKLEKVENALKDLKDKQLEEIKCKEEEELKEDEIKNVSGWKVGVLGYKLLRNGKKCLIQEFIVNGVSRYYIPL